MILTRNCYLKSSKGCNLKNINTSFMKIPGMVFKLQSGHDFV